MFLYFRISLTIESGILVGIVGHVGSGKSSLIAALLGEMEKLTGNVIINVRLIKFDDNPPPPQVVLPKGTVSSRVSDSIATTMNIVSWIWQPLRDIHTVLLQPQI